MQKKSFLKLILNLSYNFYSNNQFLGVNNEKNSIFIIRMCIWI